MKRTLTDEFKKRVTRSRIINEICFSIMRKRLGQQKAYRKRLNKMSLEELCDEYKKIMDKEFK